MCEMRGEWRGVEEIRRAEEEVVESDAAHVGSRVMADARFIILFDDMDREIPTRVFGAAIVVVVDHMRVPFLLELLHLLEDALHPPSIAAEAGDHSL